MEKQIIRKLEKIITSYIPKHSTCAIEEKKREYLRGKEKAEIVQQIEKVENPANISIDNEWVTVPPDMSVCRVCSEVSYSNMKQMVYKFNGEVIPQGRPAKVCEPCFIKMDK